MSLIPLQDEQNEHPSNDQADSATEEPEAKRIKTDVSSCVTF